MRPEPSSPPERPAAPTAGKAEARAEIRVHADASAVAGIAMAASHGSTASKGYGQAAIGQPSLSQEAENAAQTPAFSPVFVRDVATYASTAVKKP